MCNTQTHVQTHTHTHTHTHTLTHTHTHIRTNTHTYTRTRTHAHTHTHHTHKYTRTHTYTHTHTRSAALNGAGAHSAECAAFVDPDSLRAQAEVRCCPCSHVVESAISPAQLHVWRAGASVYGRGPTLY